AQLSAGLNARAFTIGSEVAFGAGEYRPGTLIGDALLAHELAHVVQQRGAAGSSQLFQHDGESDALEDDADHAAVRAVIYTRSDARTDGAGAGQQSLPRLRSSLGLRRCGKSQSGWNPECVLDILCKQDKAVVTDLQKLTVKEADSISDTKWDFKDGAWASQPVHPTGMNQPDEGLVVITRAKPCAEAAQTLFHEARHQKQPPEIMQNKFNREMDAYLETEKWAIRRGLPEPPRKESFRKQDPATGATVPNEEVIREFIIAHYGGPDAAGAEVVGHQEPNKTELKQPDGSKTTRESLEGDSYLEMEPLLADEKTIPKKT